MISFLKNTLCSTALIVIVSLPVIAEAANDKESNFTTKNVVSTEQVIKELSIPSFEDRILELSTDKKVNLSINGVTKEVVTKAYTVKDFLIENNINLDKNDVVIPSAESKLKKEDSIAIIHFLEEFRTEKSGVDFKKVEKYSFDLPYGETKILVKGEKGLLEKTYKKTLKNSIVLSDEKIKEEVKKEPINEKVVIGTKEIVAEEILYEVVEETNESIYEGESKVSQEGKEGKRIITYENKDGTRTLIDNKVDIEPVNKVVQIGTKKNPVTKVYSAGSTDSQSSSVAKYTLSQFMFNGVIRDNGKKFTYYSQSVLPGGGLSIPGRHVSDAGYVSDKDGFIVVASNRGISKGSIIDTPFGAKGKVYDICASCSPEWFDIYTK